MLRFDTDASTWVEVANSGDATNLGPTFYYNAAQVSGCRTASCPQPVKGPEKSAARLGLNSPFENFTTGMLRSGYIVNKF